MWLSLNTCLRSSHKCDGISLIVMDGYLLILLHRWLLIYRGLLLIRLLLTKCGGDVGSCPNDMNMLGVGDVICHHIFVFIPMPCFVVAWTSILGIFLIKFDDTILDDPLF